MQGDLAVVILFLLLFSTHITIISYYQNVILNIVFKFISVCIQNYFGSSMWILRNRPHPHEISRVHKILQKKSESTKQKNIQYF